MIFQVVLERAKDGRIVAEYPALPGCVLQGKDEKESLENIKEASHRHTQPRYPVIGDEGYFLAATVRELL